MALVGLVAGLASTAGATPMLSGSAAYHVIASTKAPTHTSLCSGTIEEPGVLAGDYYGDVNVEGVCEVDAGPANVDGNLTLNAGSTLLAAFALNDQSGGGRSTLRVQHNLRVLSGASAFLGCDPTGVACLDEPEGSGRVHVYGSLREIEPLGVVMHNSIVDGNVSERGGGGGETCEPTGVFALFGSPVYSDYESSIVHGNIHIAGLNSCWLGVIRERVGGSVRVVEDQLADPDAIEILSNRIGRNLHCVGDSNTWDTADETEESFPRSPEPNLVHGRRSGQCVTSSPLNEGEGPGTSPF